MKPIFALVMLSFLACQTRHEQKPDGSVYLKEFDGDKIGDTNWKRLKINW